MEFHEKLQALRKQKGLTQEELAAALYVSRTAVSKWESGRGYPNIDSLKALAKFFSVTVDELLSGENLLALAKDEQREKENRMRGMVFGLLDISALMLFFLPLMGLETEGVFRAVSLWEWQGKAPYMRFVYIAAVLLLALGGIWKLMFQKNSRDARVCRGNLASLLFNAAVMFLFILGRHPYGAAFFLVFLAVKAFMLMKKP